MSAEVARTLVHRPTVEVLPETSLRAVAAMLDEESIGLAIVRAPHPPAPGTKAAGLVSERDIVRAVAEGYDPDTTRADEVMTVDIASVHSGEPIRAVAARMLDNEIRHLPVTTGDAVVGVVSMRDVLEAMLDPREDPELIADV